MYPVFQKIQVEIVMMRKNMADNDDEKEEV
jgi:hypothetical protein